MNLSTANPVRLAPNHPSPPEREPMALHLVTVQIGSDKSPDDIHEELICDMQKLVETYEIKFVKMEVR